MNGAGAAPKEVVRVFAPATVANVACAFDILGFAIDEPGDEVVARRGGKGVTITRVTGDDGRLPLAADRNTAGVAAGALLAALGSDIGVELEVHKRMPLGSGLGSSAASAVGAVVAVNELLGRPLSRAALLPFAMEGERVACGSAHADNVAPSLLGGFVLIRSYQPLDVVPVPVGLELHCAVVHPHVEVRTEDARKILKSTVSLKDAVTQWGNAAGLLLGLVVGDAALLSRSIRDVIIEPARSILIPGFDAVKAAARDAGALGCSISGSGPSLFALAVSAGVARAVADAMEQAFRASGVQCDLHLSRVNTRGAVVLEEGDA